MTKPSPQGSFTCTPPTKMLGAYSKDSGGQELDHFLPNEFHPVTPNDLVICSRAPRSGFVNFEHCSGPHRLSYMDEQLQAWHMAFVYTCQDHLFVIPKTWSQSSRNFQPGQKSDKARYANTMLHESEPTDVLALPIETLVSQVLSSSFQPPSGSYNSGAVHGYAACEDPATTSTSVPGPPRASTTTSDLGPPGATGPPSASMPPLTLGPTSALNTTSGPPRASTTTSVPGPPSAPRPSQSSPRPPWSPYNFSSLPSLSSYTVSLKQPYRPYHAFALRPSLPLSTPAMEHSRMTNSHGNPSQDQMNTTY